MKEENVLTTLNYQIELLEKVKNKNPTSRYISIFLDEEDGYLIKLENIFKIGKVEHIAKLGICKDWFSGIISVNNAIYSLINLNQILNKESDKKQNEMILLQDSSFAIGFYKVGGLINLEDLVELSQNNKQSFIGREFLHKTSGSFLKELNINELLNFEDLHNIFKGFH